MPRTAKIQKEEKETAEKKEAVEKTVKKAEKAENNLQINVYNVEGKETGKMTLPKSIFSVEVSPQVMAQYMRVYLANQRQGTAATKTRGQVSGTTKKIYRQKGTGRARHGSAKAPIFVGGGVTHGPHPRDFGLRINKKQRRQALFYALSLKAKEGDFLGLTNEFLKIEPKTKIMASFLKKMGLDKTRIILMVPKVEKNNLILASRNISNMDIIDAATVNAYELMKKRRIMIVEDALKVLEKQFSNQ